MTLILPIEPGKRYVRRDGKIIEAREGDLGDDLALSGDTYVCRATGRAHGRSTFAADIVAGVPEPRAAFVPPDTPRVIAALENLIVALERSKTEDGVCMCGDYMAGHPCPTMCGHSPVDAGEYVAAGTIKEARAVIAMLQLSPL